MKIFASDFDNTLFFHSGDNGYIRKDDIEKIKAFQAEGNLFGLCTGRSLYDVHFDLKDTIDFDFYILVSGAVILDKNYHVLHKVTIPFSVIKDMYLYFQNKYNYSPLFVTEEKFCCINQKIYNVDTAIYQSVDEMSAFDFISVSYVLESAEAASVLCRELNSRYKDSLIGYQNTASVDIVYKGNSKGTGIEFIKNYLKADKIYGIGDSYNDLPMLEKTDISFTFHSSPEYVKQQADYLVDSISEALLMIENIE